MQQEAVRRSKRDPRAWRRGSEVLCRNFAAPFCNNQALRLTRAITDLSEIGRAFQAENDYIGVLIAAARI